MLCYYVAMLILDTEQCKDYYNRCIKFAERFLIIMSPYYNFGEYINLNDIDENWKNMNIVILYRNDDKHPEKPAIKPEIYEILNKKVKILENNNNVLMKGLPYLHAKALINEKFAIMGSLNFTDCSIKQNNIESSVVVFSNEGNSIGEDKKEDVKCYKELCLYIASNYNDEAKKIWQRYKDKFHNKGKLSERLNFLEEYFKEDFLFSEEFDFNIIEYLESFVKDIED